MPKMLKEKYKTWKGADARSRFENGVAMSEFKSGCKSKLYRYTVEKVDDSWRVVRHVDDCTPQT